MPAYTHLDDDYAALRLGARIREERKRKGWTLAELAARLALSIGTLSAIENQKLPVHVDLLFALCHAFGVGVDVLLPRTTTLHFHIARRGQMESQPPLPLKVVNLATESLLSYHNRLWPLAKPFVGKHLEPFEIEVQPIGDDKLRFISHNHEEFVFVLRGRIQCLIKTPDGLADPTLEPGDCIYFWSYLPHCIRSVDPEPARTIHVDYSPQETADAEYSNNGSGPAIYLIDAGQENPAGQIAGKIVALRKASGMSTAHLARQIGISARRLKQIESARKPIPLDLLLRVCSAFQKPKEYFLVHSVVERPFLHVLRARDIRRPGDRGQAARRGCSAEGSARPLAEGFPTHGMQPFLVRLDRSRQTPRAVRHAGQEFVYVLRGAVRFITTRDRQAFDEVLLPGDACFLDSSVPHAFSETQLTPYEQPGADMLVVRWSRVPRSQTPGLA